MVQEWLEIASAATPAAPHRAGAMSAGRNVLPQGAHASTAIFRCVGDRGYVDGAFFSKWFGTSPPTLGRHLRTSPPACGRHVPISSPGRRDLRAAGPHLRAVGREVPPFGRHLPPFGRHLRPPGSHLRPPGCEVRGGRDLTSARRGREVRGRRRALGPHLRECGGGLGRHLRANHSCVANHSCTRAS